MRERPDFMPFFDEEERSFCEWAILGRCEIRLNSPDGVVPVDRRIDMTCRSFGTEACRGSSLSVRRSPRD
jgi:hypothetical protein